MSIKPGGLSEAPSPPRVQRDAALCSEVAFWRGSCSWPVLENVVNGGGLEKIDFYVKGEDKGYLYDDVYTVYVLHIMIYM